MTFDKNGRVTVIDGKHNNYFGFELTRVQKLKFIACRLSESILEYLPSWSSELRDLEFDFNRYWPNARRALQFESLRNNFPK